jgi:hypothetical protein
MLPSGISSHPDIYPSNCVEFQGRPPEQEKEEKFQILNSIINKLKYKQDEL